MAETSNLTKTAAILIAAISCIGIVESCNNSNEQERKSKEAARAEEKRVASLTPEQKAAEAKAKSDAATKAAKDKELESLRSKKAGTAAMAIRAMVRNPASLSFESIRTNEDGSVICMTYRAQNGFGGMNLEPAIFTGDKMARDQGKWNKYCAGKSMYDMKDEAEYWLSMTKQ